MTQNTYRISNIFEMIPEVFQLKLVPKDGTPIFSFQPGQFVQLINPSYAKPHEAHLFSIASTPLNKDSLEITFRVYGNWTKACSRLVAGDELIIKGPLGRFVWDPSIRQAVFLAGGVGITPFISMLRTIISTETKPHITLLYGNRAQDSILYQKEVEDLTKQLPSLEVIHILSHLSPEDSWTGYRGFVTEDIVRKEVDLTKSPTWFICGPPIFVTHIRDLLKRLAISEQHVKFELFSGN